MRTESDTTLRILRSLRELHDLEPAWTRLWLADPGATPFAHPAWLIPWWIQFAQPEMRVGTVWHGDALVALLPLYLLPQPAGTQMLLLGAGTSDYLDAVIDPSCTGDELGLLLLELLAEPGWQTTYLTQLRAESRLLEAVRALPPEHVPARSFFGESCSTCAASQVAELPAKLRSDVRYFRNAAIGHGKLKLVRATAPELQETFDLLVRFHTERWREAGEPGVLADPLVLAHHRASLPKLEAAGLLRLMRLELGGEPIAVLYSMADPPTRPRRTQYFYLMGYSLMHRDLRPGMLLTALCSEHAVAEGISTLDMLRGEEVYKQFWRVQPRPTSGFAISPPKPRSMEPR